ncbi:MAG: DUF1192 domain-containing protein [Blastomonas sp.]
MDMDEILPPKKADAARMLGKEDLDPYSPAEIDERVALLRAEIERCEARKQQALSHRASADALFRK